MDGYADQDRDNAFTARYLHEIARNLDRFEFFAVDPRGIVRTHHFGAGYVPPTLGPRDVSEQRATVGARADQALADCARGLVWGTAGSGKSTLMRWLAVRAVRDQPDPDTMGQDGSGGPVPFLVELGRFPEGELPGLERLVGQPLAQQMPAGWVDRIFANGRALLLLDGLDEVVPHQRDAVEAYMRRQWKAYPKARYVITTRPLPVMEQWWVDHDFKRFDLLAMSRESIQTFVQGWHTVAKEDYSGDTERDLRNRRWLDSCERDLLDTLTNRPALGGMAANPLLCGLLCAIHLDRGRNLPEVRNLVFDAAIDLLLVRWPQLRRLSLADGIAVSSVTDSRLSSEEQLKLLQRLAHSMVANREPTMSLDNARKRIRGFMVGLRNQGEDPDQVLQYIAVHSGLLRELPDRSLQFVHRTFCEYLTAREVIDEGHLGQMLDSADKPEWQNVVVMAGAYARPTEARTIIQRLVKRGQHEPRQKDTLLLLAAAILEQVSVLAPPQPGEPDSHQLVTQAVTDLLPPRTVQAADQLGMAGSFVLDLLPGPDTLTDGEAALVVRTIAVIAAIWDPPGALDKILRFTATRSAAVMAQLLEPWGRSGDYERYARTVLAEVDFGGIPVELQGAARVSHIGYLKTTTDLVLSGDLRDLRPLADLPVLRHLTLERNTLVSLGSLVGCRALRRLRLAQCSSLAEARPVDLSPLAALRLEELAISGLLCRVDLAGLAGVTLQSLDVRGTRRGFLVTVPHGLTVESISMNGLPHPAEIRALRRLDSLRRLVLYRVPTGADPPTLPGVEVEIR